MGERLLSGGPTRRQMTSLTGGAGSPHVIHLDVIPRSFAGRRCAHAGCRCVVTGSRYGGCPVLPGVRLLGPAVVVVGPFHEQHPRQIVQEDQPHPPGHAVGTRRTEVPVYYDHRDEYSEDVHDEGEQEVLGDQRDRDGRGRQDLADQ